MKGVEPVRPVDEFIIEYGCSDPARWGLACNIGGGFLINLEASILELFVLPDVQRKA